MTTRPSTPQWPRGKGSAHGKYLDIAYHGGVCGDCAKAPGIQGLCLRIVSSSASRKSSARSAFSRVLESIVPSKGLVLARLGHYAGSPVWVEAYPEAMRLLLEAVPDVD